MAFGVLGLLPYDYYCLLPHEFESMIEGYKRKQYHDSSERRKAAYLSLVPFVKDISFQNFCVDWWPLQGDEKLEDRRDKLIEPPTVDAELWQALKKQMRPRDEKAEYEKILSKHKIIRNG